MNNHDIDTIIPPPEGGLTPYRRSVSLALARIARGRTLIVATHDRSLAARIGRVIDVSQLDAAPAQRRAA